jgi:hypothetical protein
MTTTPDRKLNPELYKAAADMADPDGGWQRGDNISFGVPFVRVSTGPSARNTGRRVFDIFKYQAYAWALERKLKYEGWEFSQDYLSKRYKAKKVAYSRDGFTSDIETDESDILLLLKCVAAMHSLDLYVEAK